MNFSKDDMCEHFCNNHCCSNDCPNIQYEYVENKYGYGIADDIGLERISCKKCNYNVKNCTCEDCLFLGSNNCKNFIGVMRDTDALYVVRRCEYKCTGNE